MSSRLAVVQVNNRITDPMPAAFHEKGAFKYLGMSRPTFLQLVYAGTIPFCTHANGSQRIYLRSDLDAYLAGRPKTKLGSAALGRCFSKPAPIKRGAGK